MRASLTTRDWKATTQDGRAESRRMEIPRRSFPLRWALAFLPAVAALAMGLVMYGVTERVIREPLQARAAWRVDQAAAVFADLTARAIARRLAELTILARSGAFPADASVDALRRQVEGLVRGSPGTPWAGVADPTGRIRAGSDGRWEGALWGSATDIQQARQAGSWVGIAQRPQPSDAPSGSSAMVIVLRLADADAPGFVISHIDPRFAEGMRSLILGDADPKARLGLELSLLDAQGAAVLGAMPPVPAAAWQALPEAAALGAALQVHGVAQDAGAGGAARRQFVIARASVFGAMGAMPAWNVLAYQDLAQALAPAVELERGLLLLVVAAALLAGGVGMWAARRLTRPYAGALDALALRVESELANSPSFTRHLDGLVAQVQGGPAALQDNASPEARLLAEVAHDAERLRGAIDELPVALYITDAAWRVRLWSGGAQRLFGWSAAEVLGQHLPDLLRGDMLEPQLAAVRSKHLSQRTAFGPTRVRVLHRDGHPIWGEWLATPLPAEADIDADAIPDYVVHIRDTTREERAISSSREASWKLSVVLDLMLDVGFVLLDANAAVTGWSRGALLLGRRPPEGLLGLHHDEFFAESDRADGLPAWLRAREQRDGRAEFEGWCMRADGSCFWGQLVLYAIPAEAGGAAGGFVQITRDLTARRESEQAVANHQIELSALTQTLLGQEKSTTQRVAQALHDHLGQTLAIARLNLEAGVATLGPNAPETSRARFDSTARLLEQAVREVRQVLVDLRPPLLDEHGLEAALDNEVRARAMLRPGTDLLLEVGDGAAGQRGPADVEYGAFMVAREAITNAQQHAGATLIRLVLGGDDGSLGLDIVDDGTGVPAGLAQGRPGHLGMVGMRERATAIGAVFSVSAGPAGGTVVSLRWEATPK